MKFTTDRPFADPEKAARRLMEHARAFEPVQDGRIYIEKINGAVPVRSIRAHRKSMRRASRSPSNAAGLNSMTAGPSFGSRKAARTCSHSRWTTRANR